ncbi:STAS domain-containing protein [Streptomyces sp. H27-C3]|uniref:STAS domain-containing protein n=1 Tax=Streptomyces sp. H27-C3 TaxID=3046305 RepID=UPI0024B9558A|nr:STAS domain-containing protein [Streptomyces sp. H27-C3]MDJ0466647.1 STAS domain-containing protein [Streptomyces sp. H27-C3]
MPHPPPSPGPRCRWPALLRGKRGTTGAVVVRLRGEIDANRAERTSRVLLDALSSSPTDVEVDLSRVPHLSADGTLAFFTALKDARRRGTQLRVTQAHPQVAAMLRRVGLSSALDTSGQQGTGSP